MTHPKLVMVLDRATGATILRPETDDERRVRLARNAARRAKDQAMRDLGMAKVRGALGGTYWE